MPRAGLAESRLELLRAAVADEEAVARFRAKIRVVPGSACLWWCHAVSERGHGQYSGSVDGRRRRGDRAPVRSLSGQQLLKEWAG